MFSCLVSSNSTSAEKKGEIVSELLTLPSFSWQSFMVPVGKLSSTFPNTFLLEWLQARLRLICLTFSWKDLILDKWVPVALCWCMPDQKWEEAAIESNKATTWTSRNNLVMQHAGQTTTLLCEGGLSFFRLMFNIKKWSLNLVAEQFFQKTNPSLLESWILDTYESHQLKTPPPPNKKKKERKRFYKHCWAQDKHWMIITVCDDNKKRISLQRQLHLH